MGLAESPDLLRWMFRACRGPVATHAWTRLNRWPAPEPGVHYAQPPDAPPSGARAQKVTYAQDTFFDWMEALLLPVAASKLDELVARMEDCECALEVVVIAGREAPDEASGVGLGELRAQAIQNYLVAAGVPAAKIYAASEASQSQQRQSEIARERRASIEIVMRARPGFVGPGSKGKVSVQPPVETPRTGIGAVQVDSPPGRSFLELRDRLEQDKGAYYQAYRRALDRNPGLSARLLISITVSPAGIVTDAELVASSLEDPDLERALLTVARAMDFGPRPVRESTLTFPLDLVP